MGPSRALVARRIGRDEAGYPWRLREIPDPPEALYVLGRDLEALGRRVAIVGTRRATAYGREIARALAADLATCGLCVVSGMARGIDTEAHRGALSVDGTTIAILAGSATEPYPPSNERLHPQIVAAGAVVSERPEGWVVGRHSWLERNRIIAGIAEALVFVQGVEEKSGAWVTATLANEYGRQVLAVPGDVRAPASSGPHAMLRAGAAPCTGAADVLRALAMEHTVPGAVGRAPANLEEPARRILASLHDEAGTVAHLVARTSLSVSEVGRWLTRLEMARLARLDGDGMWRAW